MCKTFTSIQENIRLKSFVASLLFILLAQSVEAQVVFNSTYFPDKSFRQWLSATQGWKEGDTLPQDTLNRVQSIIVDNSVPNTPPTTYKFESVKGIEKFPNLKNLNLTYHSLKKIDVSKNTKLVHLYLNNNQLTSLNLKGLDSLENIQLNNNKLYSDSIVWPDNTSKITILYISNNKDVSELDVTKFSSLETLSCNNCSIKSLDVSKSTKLKKLYCEKNGLTSLTIGKDNTALTIVNANKNNISTIDLSAATSSLTNLYLEDFPLKEMDFSDFANLSELNVNNCGLSSLDLSKNTNIKRLYVSNNSLGSLDVSNLTKLSLLSASKCDLRELKLPESLQQQLDINIAKNHLGYFNLSGYTTGQNANFSNAGAQTLSSKVQVSGDTVYLEIPEVNSFMELKPDNVSDFKYKTTENASISLVKASDCYQGLGFRTAKSGERISLFSYDAKKKTSSPISMTYKYGTGANNTNVTALNTLSVTDTVQAYILPMSAEYGSVNLPFNTTIPTGAVAYYVSRVDTDGHTLTLTKLGEAGTVVPALTPMLIQRTDGTITHFAFNATSEKANGVTEVNLLKGTTNTAIDNDATHYYVLGLGNAGGNYAGQLGFFHSTQNKIGSWRAYLDLSNTGTTSAKGFRFVIDNNVTNGITTIGQSGVEDGAWYTLSGIKLNGEPTEKGIYVHNGKKVILR